MWCDSLKNNIVFYDRGMFAAWPANNGIWIWDSGREALVGFVTGAFREQEGHNIVLPYTHRFARTANGGDTWTVETPSTFPPEDAPLRELQSPIDFRNPDVILRCIGDGYHGSNEKRGGFLISRDRGRTWDGPFRFGNLNDATELDGWELTPRTDYHVIDRDHCGLGLSARPRNKSRLDAAFWANMSEGGKKVTFTGWIVPPSDPYRGVMPATIALSERSLLSAVRRRKQDANVCWLDLYTSENAGAAWQFRAKIADTGDSNGNPSALLRLRDKRLLCAYGDRAQRKMFVRLSSDEGRTWLPPLTLRDDYIADSFGDSDFGYPRAFERPDGQIVVVYYWSNAERKQHHIATTTLKV